ncbi:MAG: hypothetical protein HY876_02600, partial [Coriobacteriales bacterium]|nr:hypothetical protein [Coriobacteriales bacterium]
RYPDLEPFSNARFSTEEDPVWVGATYDALPGVEPLDTLASVDGRSIVASRRWGQGRIIFVGGNLIWHAFVTGNPDEAALVRAIFDDALSSPDATIAGRTGRESGM